MTSVYIDCGMPAEESSSKEVQSLLDKLSAADREPTVFSSYASYPLHKLRRQLLASPYSERESLIFALRNARDSQIEEPNQLDWYCWLGSNQSSFNIGFSNPRLQFRIGARNLQHELLLRAIKGRAGGFDSRVLDCTGGLMRDAAIMASAGFNVMAIEQNALLATVMNDSLQRNFQFWQQLDLNALETMPRSHASDSIWQLDIKSGNSVALIEAGQLPEFDVVYLDPMYDGGLKPSASVKSEMQFLRALDTWYGGAIQADADRNTHEQSMLQLAREFALKKVVVKRAPNAPYLADCKPASSIGGKALRFDIYPT